MRHAHVRPALLVRLAFLLAVLGAVAMGGDREAHAAERIELAKALVARPGVLVIAHRGDSAVAPENTLPAFESAVRVGADLVELDYLHSADGVPMVFHDKHLDRTSDAVKRFNGAKIELASKSAQELQTLDAGSWFHARFAGTRLPTLVEALDVIQAGSMTLIERKSGEPATCIELLKQKQLLDKVVVQAFDWKFLEGCHQLAPALVLGALGDKECTPAKLDQVAKTGAAVVGWEDKYTSAATIGEIHRRGLKAWVWTVDKPERAIELVRAGVDGIITNRPGAIREAVAGASPNVPR